MLKGFFIVIEGLDGSGKSELTRRLAQFFRNSFSEISEKVLLTFEPHDPSCAGLFIRQVLTHQIVNVPAKTLALAFAVNRADHLNREILPFLQRDKNIVISDRYYLSSLVFQSGELAFDEVMELNSTAIKPDLTIFLNASSRVCYQRMKIRPEKKELFEVNLDKTRSKYHSAIKFLSARGENITSIDADADMDSVFNQALDAILAFGVPWIKNLLNQAPLLAEPNTEVFLMSENIETVIFTEANSILNRIKSHLIDQQRIDFSSNQEIEDGLLFLKKAIENSVNLLPVDEIGKLFLLFLNKSGYKIVGKLPWTDISVYEIEYSLPLGLAQRGTAFFLDEVQRYALIVKQKLPEIVELSDFMIIFEAKTSSNSQMRYNYERQVITYTGGEPENTVKLSPSTRSFSRADLVDYILEVCMDELEEIYLYTIVSTQTTKKVWHDIKKRLSERTLRQ